MMLTPIGVTQQRVALANCGYKVVKCNTRSKKPYGAEWNAVAESRDAAFWATDPVSNDQLNTGVLARGLCAVDIDITDRELATEIVSEAKRLLGNAPLRFRADSSKCLLLYRTSETMTKKHCKGSKGAVECLSAGQQFIVSGTHPDGAEYQWDYTLTATPLASLTQVTPQSVRTFLDSISDRLGVESKTFERKPPSGVQAVSPVPTPPPSPTTRPATTEEAQRYAFGVLAKIAQELSEVRQGGRNDALNNAAHAAGTMVGAGWIDADEVGRALHAACVANGLAAEDKDAAAKTFSSGLAAGIAKPRDPLTIPVEIDATKLMVGGKTAAEQMGSKRTLTAPVAAVRKRIELLPMSNYTPKLTTWLWNGYLPSGMLTLLCGAGGTGKSTIAFHLASVVTTGGVWPDKTQCARPGNVLIWSSEDDIERTIVPRLLAAGADLNRVAPIVCTPDESGNRIPFDPATDTDGLREAVRSVPGGVSLMIIDPIVSAIHGDMNKANEVRRGLQALVDFAAEFDCAVLGITHFAKNTNGRNTADRVIGSQAFAAFARMVLATAKEEDSERRVFTRAKSNISPDDGGFHYTIQQVAVTSQAGQLLLPTRVAWGDEIEGSSRAILADVEGEDLPQAGKRMESAKEFLYRVLADGQVAVSEVKKQAKAAGISEITLRRAREAMQVIITKSGDVWWWTLAHHVVAPLELRAMAGD